MEVTIDEAKSIIAREDPRSKGYYGGDATIREAVEKSFAVAHPGQTDLSGSSLLSGEMPPQTPAQTPEVAEPDFDQTKADASRDEVKQTLEREWGWAFKENMEAGGRAIQALFPDAQAFEQAVVDAGIHLNPALQIKAVKLLAEIGHELKKGRK